MEKDPKGNEEPQVEDKTSHEAVLKLLEESKVKFDTLVHAPTKTSEESANLRGVPLASGAKAMVVKNSNVAVPVFLLVVMSASKKLSWKAIRSYLKGKNVQMASPEEVFKCTKCIPGAVPPFGNIFGIPTYVDKSLIDQGETINFNAGLRTFSVMNLKVSDYLEILKPTIVEFSE